MMEESQKERLYYLLPTIYRVRDTLQGESLRALMDALESEFRIVEQDIDALYDNWFIETCDDWVVPYIASQIGVYSPDDTRKLFPGQRRQVADTIAYRRRKGMIAILEHVLRDVTGWYVRLVEYSQLLSLAPHLRNISERGRFANLHQATELALLGGPFETTAHTIDMRRIAPETTSEPQSRALQGKYSPDHVGVFVWRLQSYLMNMVPAGAITRVGKRDLQPGCFTFDPLGRDMPLFTQPQEVTALTERPDAVNLPGSISRVAFANDLKAYRVQHRHITAEEDLFADEDLSGNSVYYGPQRSLCVMLNGQPIPPEAVTSADLSQWNALSASSQERESVVAIDVMLGRLRLLHRQSEVASEMVEVNYCYGFSADLGGGPYTRQLPPASTPRQRINVLQGGKVSTLTQALKEWETCYSTWVQQHQTGDDNPVDKPRCTIHIVDNGFYEGNLVINLPENADVVIEATDGVRPVIHGALIVNSEQGSAHLQLNGLLIDGQLDINGSLDLEILHCTLMPHGLEARHHPANIAPTRITIDHSISGPIHLRNVKSELLVRDSIIDHATGSAIDSVHTTSSHGPLIDLERVTIFGKVELQELRLAQDVIFTAPVEVKQQQCGLVSFSYIPAHSHTPRREHCQPQRMIHARNNAQLPDRQSQSEENDPVYPLFTSTHYGNVAYAQLDNRCSPHIQRGASNGSEMGAFNSLRQAQRQDNISQMLDEYLPFGLAAGVFYAT